MPSHQIQLPVWSLRKGCWTSASFLRSGYALGWGGAGAVRDGDEDPRSGWGGGSGRMENDDNAWSGVGGRVGGGAGGWEVVALSSFLAWLGAGAPLFRLARLGGIRGGRAVGAWGWKKGCLACWPGLLSGGSAGVCMVAFAWLRLRSASLRTVSGGAVGHGSAAGLLWKGWWRW